MKPTTHRTCRRSLLILPTLILPLLIAATPPRSARAQQQDKQADAQTATDDARALRFTVTVVGAKGGFITGLTRDDFSVWEGKTRREIGYFDREDTPASVGLLIDVSASVQRPTLAWAKYAAAKFVERSHPGNEYFVGQFNHERHELIGWTRDAREVLRGLDKLAVRPDAARAKPEPGGQTAFYDACAAALDALARRPNPKRVLLLITDGQDNSSRLKFSELRRKVLASDVQIYCLNQMMSAAHLDMIDVTALSILETLATESGGAAYFPGDQKDLDEKIERIVVGLRHQYVIGFTPTNAAPGGKWNKVKIKVTPTNPSLKNLSARSREGYFSPAP